MGESEDKKLEEFRNKLLSAGEDELTEMRLWLFKETCKLEDKSRVLNDFSDRLERERDKFYEDRERSMAKLEREREALWEKEDLADQKLDMLREAYDRLDDDRKELERQKSRLEKEKAFDAAAAYYSGDTEVFFVGVNSEISVKKRYKDLLKIYHPDNMCGDAKTLHMINQEYEYYCRLYQMKA